MKAQELSRKYATAVFSQALETWLATLKKVQDKLAINPGMTEKLVDTSRSFSDRQKMLDDIIPAEAGQYVRNFLYTMLKEGDISLLGEVLEQLDRMMQGGPQIEVAQVTTALPLDDEDKEALRRKLQQTYGENLEFIFKVDSKLLGGVIVRIGDKVIDGSVANRLESLRNRLGVK